MARSLWVASAAVALLVASHPLRSATPTAKTTAEDPSLAAHPSPTVAVTAIGSPEAKPLAAQHTAVPSTGTAKVEAKAVAVSGTAKPAAKPLSGTAQALSATASSANHKSVALARVLSWVPGVAVHGAGHLYGGSYMKGAGLMLVEGAAIYGGLQVLNRNNLGKVDISNIMGGDLSGANTDIGITLVCGLGFIWSWWDDIAGAGIAVDEYNKLQDEAAAGSHAQLQLLPAPGGAMLAYSHDF